MKKLLTIGFVLTSFLSFGQVTKKVLFLGNSYTAYNSLPNLVANLANSKGNVLIQDSNTPGGQRLLQHAVNPTSLSKIASNNWDYVVLQGQSLEGAFPDGQLASEVYPYAEILNDSVKSNNECSETMFYMTWGRENGHQQNCQFYPPFCTYDGMQSRLRHSYSTMADQNDGSVAPVGEAWRYVRNNYPAIDLYIADESHPSAAGSYLAACVFYVSIYRESISGSTYYGSIPQADAIILQDVASMTVLDSLNEWNIGSYDAMADFYFSGNGTNVNFTNNSTNATDYTWNFGDMNTSNSSDPSHSYASVGTYNVMLIADNGCTVDTSYQNVDLNTLNISENTAEIRTWNDASEIRIFTDKKIDAFEIYAMNGVLVQNGILSEKTISINQLEKGLYLLRLMEGSNTFSIRIMK